MASHAYMHVRTELLKVKGIVLAKKLDSCMAGYAFMHDPMPSV